MPKTRRKKNFRIIWLLLMVLLAFGVRYAWQAFPIITGYGAKNLASAVYLQHRDPETVIKEELSDAPFNLATYTVNRQDSSVIGSILGMAKKKAIYRTGAGCTLVNGFTETQLRQQSFTIPPPPAGNRDSLAWPSGDKTIDGLPSAIDKKALEAAINSALGAATAGGKPALTRAVLVVYGGQIVGERYAPGFDKNTVMLGWSVSKSLTSALIGLLVREGRLQVDAPAPVPEWKGTDRQAITIKNLLQQTSGLDFEEAYTKPSEVTNMLFKEGDMAAFTANRPLKHKPGTLFSYSSGNTNILSRIIRHTVGEAQYKSFPYTALFYKLGMYSMRLEPDPSGTYIGSSYSYATARDFARFGLLYYNKGIWNGEQILPVGWVAQTVQPATADPRRRYGYCFWLNGKGENNPNQRHFPDAPADLFYADGFGGQGIYIIPSKKLVVVRLGLHSIDENKFLKEILASVK